MNKLLVILLTLCLVLPAEAHKGRGAPSTAAFNPMGINFSAGGGGTTYYEAFPIFKNRVRESAGFTDPASFPNTVALDSSGWPTANFQVVLFSQGSGTATFSWLTGLWDCGFQGTGSETISSLNGSTITNIVHHASPTYSTFNITNLASNQGFQVTGVSASPNNPKNIFCYLPAYPGSVIDDPTQASAFTTEAINHYSTYGWIRWMVWNKPITNATTMTATNRLTPANTQASYANSASEGIPQEWAISFCLAANVDCWLNLPNIYDVSFSYITSLANAINAAVPAGRHIYLEIGDELWNGAGAGSILWNSTANAYMPGGAIGYYAYQAHSIAGIFRTIFGARYGTDIRLVMAWQTQGNGFGWQFNLYNYYNSNGWAIGVNNGGDFYTTAIAPYININGPTNSMTIAQIDANLITESTARAFDHTNSFWWQIEQNKVMGLKWGLYQTEYEGGWQTNAESSSTVNVGASIMDSGMTTVMNDFYQVIANSGARGLSTFTGGIDSDNSSNLSPIDELSTAYPITTGTSPRFASIVNYTGGWTSQRNVVTTPGASIAGGSYLDTVSGTSNNLGSAGSGNPGDAPNLNFGGELTYLECSTVSRTASLVVNFSNSGGSAGATELEYGSAPAGFTVLGGGTPTSVSIPTGTNNVTIGSVPITVGCGYVTLGTPNVRQGSITVNSLTFN